MTTLTPEDHDRLDTQLNKVKMLMLSGSWKTLREIADAVQGSEAGVSARLRDLRNKYHYTVSRRRIGNGLFEYQVLSGPVQTVYHFDQTGQGAFCGF